ncbi:MAG: EAL domain-containing protein [Pseudomonadota bacterium]
MDDLQQRLQMALASAHMAIWDSSVVEGSILDGMVTWSREGAVLLGFEARPLRQSFRTFLTFVHPDDRDVLLDQMQQRVSDCQDYEIEYRIVRADGRQRWLSARAQTVCEDGKPVRTLGLIWDTTERKEQELLLAEQKELAEVTLRSIGDAVITTDAGGATTFMNRAAEQLTGWSSRSAAGASIANVMRVIDEASEQPVDNVASTCLQLRQPVGTSSRHLLVTREGRRVPIEDSAAPIWAHDGAMIGAVAVLRDVSHERHLSRELNWHASHDGLTGLMNRRAFESELAHALASAKADSAHHALLFLDLDRFSVINDTCGHGVGDLVLQLLAKVLQTHLRDSDVLARLGGDELAVLLRACPLHQAISVAEGIRQAIKDFRFPYENRSLELGASVGLVAIDQNSSSVTELLIAADHACSVAKELGRNRVHLYSGSDAVLARRQGDMRWVARLNEALELEHFRLFAQPIVSMREGGGGHDEVLLRLAAGEELILPGEFIPAAERYDLMAQVDRWVIEHVCRHVAAEREQVLQLEAAGMLAPAPPQLYSINLSGFSFSDDGLVDHIRRQFAAYRIDPSSICFEITETAVITHLDKAQQFMAVLRALGCRFSLDDFGSGLSSFAYLRSLQVDYLKIDGAFVRDIAVNSVNHALVRAINEVGHVMGICTVAEFVEDQATLDAVRAIGVDYAQGYAVGKLRPMLHA